MAILPISDLKQLVQNTIYDNLDNEISGQDVQTAIINAIDTLDSLAGFVNVHKANGQTTITAYGSKAAARAAVPTDAHFEGVVIAYKLSTGWIIEQNLDTTAGTWADNASWQTIAPVNVSRNVLTIGDEPKCGVANLETDFATKESIEIYSDNDELVHKIDKEHADFKNLQSNGENVNAIPLLEKSQSFNGKGVLITKDDNTFLLRFDEFGLCVDNLYNSQGKKYLVNPITNIPITVVDANGGGNYTTIQDAIDNTQDGDVILIMPGIYNEAVKMFGKNRHLVGINKETVILTNSTGLRATPPLEANIGSVENITIYAAAGTVTEDDEVGKSYGVHIEAGYTSPYSLSFRNCKIGSRLQAGIGLGLRWNQTVIVENCEIYSEASKSWSTALEEFQDTGGFFFHNDATVSNKPGGKLIIKDSLIHGVKAALAGGSVDNGSVCSLASINNTLYSDTYGVSSDTFLAISTPISGMLVGECIELSIISHGNNNNDINYN